jgi:SAM-dependent methyltransferase
MRKLGGVNLIMGIFVIGLLYLMTSLKWLYDHEQARFRMQSLQTNDLDRKVRELTSQLREQANAPLSKIECQPTVSRVNAEHLILSVDKSLSIENPEIRDRWIAEKARTLFYGKINPNVLDVSAGAKPYKSMLTSIGWKYFSNEFQSNKDIVDSFRGESSADKGGLASQHDFLGPDISNTGAPSGEFDLVILTEVLEHLPEPALAIPELKRVSKPGGDILITAPFTSGSHQLPYHFSSGYPREWYQHVANKNDLDIISMTSQGDFFKLMAQEVGRGFGCGMDVPVSNEQVMADIKDTMYWYFLMKSKLNNDETASCYSQFTIGWMVHLRKRH